MALTQSSKTKLLMNVLLDFKINLHTLKFQLNPQTTNIENVEAYQTTVALTARMIEV